MKQDEYSTANLISSMNQNSEHINQDSSLRWNKTSTQQQTNSETLEQQKHSWTPVGQTKDRSSGPSQLNWMTCDVMMQRLHGMIISKFQFQIGLRFDIQNSTGHFNCCKFSTLADPKLGISNDNMLRNLQNLEQFSDFNMVTFFCDNDGKINKTTLLFLQFERTWYEPRHDKTNKVSVRPAKTQISLGIRPVWSESSLCAQWVAFFMRTAKTLIRLGGCLLVLSCRGSYKKDSVETWLLWRLSLLTLKRSPSGYQWFVQFS